MRVPTQSRFYRSSILLAGLVLLGSGLVSLSDRPGLVVEYFARPIEIDSRPVFRATAEPQLQRRQEVASVLVSQEIFELRWTGWLHIEEAGEYGFALKSDESSYLKLDGKEAVVTSRQTRTAESAAIPLEAGIHPIEVGLQQTGGRAWLETRWGREGAEKQLLAGEALIAHRPAWTRGALRRWWPKATGWRLGTAVLALLFGGLLTGSAFPEWRRTASRFLRSVYCWLRAPERRSKVDAWILLILLFGTAALVFPYTASTTDGDDIRYMDGARFDKQMGWNVNRYAHIYLLKGFIQANDGDAFRGSRFYWAAMLGTTVLAMALCLRPRDSGLRLGAVGLAVGILFSQAYLFGGIGAAYADYTAMMVVTLGAAAFLLGADSESRLARSGWLAALGALTFLAAKSKEPGIVLLWLLLGSVWLAGRPDWRRFGRVLIWWGAGAAVAAATLMILDAWILGDFWFGWRPSSQAGAVRLRDTAEGIWQLPRWAWLEVAWSRAPLRGLSLMAVLGAAASLKPGTPAAWRWVAWMPLAYLAMMIAIHPAIFSTRYLFPIIPVACVVAARAFAGLWREMADKGWRLGRWIALPLALLVLFGSGVLENTRQLSRRTVAQRGDWTLYPWEVFRSELQELRPREITVSTRLYRRYQMLGKSRTRDRIARLYFQRRYLKIRERQSWRRDRPAVMTRKEHARWLAKDPSLVDRTVFDPSGQVVLVLPE